MGTQAVECVFSNVLEPKLGLLAGGARFEGDETGEEGEEERLAIRLGRTAQAGPGFVAPIEWWAGD